MLLATVLLLGGAAGVRLHVCMDTTRKATAAKTARSAPGRGL